MESKAGLAEGVKVKIIESKADGTIVKLEEELAGFKDQIGEIIGWNDVEHTWKIKFADGKEQFFHSENLLKDEVAEGAGGKKGGKASSKASSSKQVKKTKSQLDAEARKAA